MTPVSGRVLAALSLALLCGCSASPPAALPAGAPQALVLVEVRGSGPESDAFVERFLSVLSDHGLGNVADARLSGLPLDTLQDPASPAAAAFRRLYPGDGYIGVSFGGCGYTGRGAIQCTATVRLLSPQGTELLAVEATGSNFTGLSDNPERSPEIEASWAAAKKAARSFLSKLGR